MGVGFLSTPVANRFASADAAEESLFGFDALSFGAQWVLKKLFKPATLDQVLQTVNSNDQIIEADLNEAIAQVGLMPVPDGALQYIRLHPRGIHHALCFIVFFILFLSPQLSSLKLSPKSQRSSTLWRMRSTSTMPSLPTRT
jgi:hypothetical protein